jgi:crotonobetainyl-CoA:carnitine CoA-transferase CaiB-like acyl-CoA transferase
MGALEGIRLLDFGQYLAGPMVAVMLADQGADVIRIDPPGGPLWNHRRTQSCSEVSEASCST